MSKLKRIPIPLRMRWHQLRLQLLPIFVCGGAALGVLTLWNDVSAPVGFPGEVEVVSGTLYAPDSGFLAEVQIDRFVQVEAGETIGSLITIPPEMAAASLAVLRAEIELTRLGWIDPVLDQQRNLLQVENLKLDSLAAKTELAIARIELMQARRELARKEQLSGSGMVAQDNLEQAQLRAEVLAAEVAGKEEVAARLEDALNSLGTSVDQNSGFSAALTATLALQGERLKELEAQLRPVPLRAPIAGVINALHFRNGEYVQGGATIMSISAPRSGMIVAYLRQPLLVPPAVGTPVEIRSRRQDKLIVTGEIVAIGPQIQELSPSLRRPDPLRHDSGLPVKISLPPELNLLPGEVVDVILR